MRDHVTVGLHLAIGLSVIATACGRVGFQALDGANVSATDAGAGDGPRVAECSVWMDTQPETALNSAANDWEPALSPDGLVLVFTSSRSGDYKLYAADRAAVGDAFGNLRLITELDEPGARHGSPAWDFDGTKLYFSRDSAALSAIFDANTRTFSQVQPAVTLLGTSWDISSDGRELFYGYTVSTGNTDLGHATRPGPGDPWNPDDAVDQLNRLNSREGFPGFSETTQELFFEVSVPTLTVWKATRGGPDMPFGTPVPVPELVSSGDPEVSRDGMEIFYSSNEARSIGGADIFVARRQCN